MRSAGLPEGYQFGDAGKGRLDIAIRFVQQWDITPDPHPWRSPSQNAAEQLAAKAEPAPPPQFLEQLQEHGHWNVIEGEDH